LIRYELLIWDFDGTLADTRELAAQTYNQIAARQGFSPITDPVRARQMPTLTFLREHGIPLTKVPWLVKQYLAATADQIHAIRFFEGLSSILRTLKDAGYRLGILSSNSVDNVSACLAANGMQEVFDFVVGYPRLFGKSTAIHRLLKRQGISRKGVLYVGDEVRDMEAARKAGVDGAAVGWGFHSLEILVNERPKFLWTTPDAVLPALLPGA
jgi:phosphoglycolate phosphatase